MGENEIQNPIVPLTELGITQIDDKSFGLLTGGNFLPRVMLMQSGSDAVKESKIQMGHLVLIGSNKNQPDDLGTVVDALLLTVRPKAMRIEGGQVVEDIYDMTDPAFDAIKAESVIKSDTVSCLYGPEFLVYLLKEKKFATFFFSTPTLRRESGTARGLLGQAVTFEKNLIKGQKQRSWFGISISVCKTPGELPPIADMKAEVEKFNKPSTRKREAVPDASQRAR